MDSLTPQRGCRTALQVKKETRNAARDLRNDSVAIVRAQREEAAKRAVRGKKASGEIMSMLQQQVSQSDDTVFRIQRSPNPCFLCGRTECLGRPAPPGGGVRLRQRELAEAQGQAVRRGPAQRMVFSITSLLTSCHSSSDYYFK